MSFQHPTPYFDDSYAVNSANNGPYADALLQELIPYLEEHFRIIPQPSARVLTGGSTGGWEALALQVHHPDVAIADIATVVSKLGGRTSPGVQARADGTIHTRLQ